jgi:hypothetical protein
MTAAGTFALDTNTYGTFTLPSLTSGSVLFSNGSTIAQDNSNFFWDATNHRLGIGTTAPSQSLEVNGSPGYIKLVSAATAEIWNMSTANNNVNMHWQRNQSGGSYNNNWFLYNPASTTNLTFNNGDSDLVTIQQGGNVGIGTTAPGDKLDVGAYAGGQGTVSQTIGINSGGTTGVSSLALRVPNAANGYGSYGPQSIISTNLINNWQTNLLFQTNSTNGDAAPTTKMMIDENGNVSIGGMTATTGPQLSLVGSYVTPAHLKLSGNVGLGGTPFELTQGYVGSNSGGSITDVTNLLNPWYFDTSDIIHFPQGLAAGTTMSNGSTPQAICLADGTGCPGYALASGPTSWTPTDASGAGLTFTGVNVSSSRVGNMVFVYGSLSYPVTANTNTAQIGGLPIAVSSGSYAYTPNGAANSTSPAVAYRCLPQGGTLSFTLTATSSSLSPTNANLSGSPLFFSFSYPIN